MPKPFIALPLPALAGCSGILSGPPGTTANNLSELTVSAPIFGEIMRAAAFCGRPASLTAQDRSALFGQKRTDIERADVFLNGEEGTSLMQRAEAARVALSR